MSMLVAFERFNESDDEDPTLFEQTLDKPKEDGLL